MDTRQVETQTPPFFYELVADEFHVESDLANMFCTLRSSLSLCFIDYKLMMLVGWKSMLDVKLTSIVRRQP